MVTGAVRHNSQIDHNLMIIIELETYYNYFGNISCSSNSTAQVEMADAYMYCSVVIMYTRDSIGQ